MQKSVESLFPKLIEIFIDILKMNNLEKFNRKNRNWEQENIPFQMFLETRYFSRRKNKAILWSITHNQRQ